MVELHQHIKNSSQKKLQDAEDLEFFSSDHQ